MGTGTTGPTVRQTWDETPVIAWLLSTPLWLVGHKDALDIQELASSESVYSDP